MNAKAPLIAGIDFSAASASVLRQAVHAARRDGGRVVAAHVLDSSSLAWRAASAGGDPAMERLMAQARQRLELLAAAEGDGVELRIEVRCGRPAEELRRLVEDTGASLLVIAANDLTKKRLGGIAASCVRSAPCDVLLLRDWQEGDFLRIVVCTDFSDSSGRALERGAALAAAHGARLDVVHVMYPPSRDIWGEVQEHETDSPRCYADECRAKVDRMMAEFVAGHGASLAGIEVRPVILESTSSATALTFHLQDSGADLAVLGTRGHSRLAGLLLGTNAERLVQDAQVSVLAVRV
jgi:universal stress protein E